VSCGQCGTSSKPRPRARNKRVWASVEKTAQAVTSNVFDEACRRDPEHRRRWRREFLGPVRRVDGAVRLGDARHSSDDALGESTRSAIFGGPRLLPDAGARLPEHP